MEFILEPSLVTVAYRLLPALLSGFSFLLGGGFAAGCANHNERAAAYLVPLEAGRWDEAAKAATKVADSGSDRSIVLDQLELGAIRLVAGEFDLSDQAFRASWNRMIELGGPENEKFIDTLGAVIINDRIMPYLGTSYDRVMCCTYQALDALAGKDTETARVLLKRAQFAQEATEARFQAKIEKAREKLEEEHEVLGKVEKSSEYKKGYQETYGTLDARFSPYKGWTIPFTDWLTAIFLMCLDETDSDRGRAIDLLRRVRGTLGENPAVESDLALARANELPTNQVWLVMESGLAPKRIEKSFRIPAFIPEMPFIGIALPDMKAVPGGPDYFAVQAGALTVNSSVVCDMGSVVSHEFKAELPLITGRAIASAITKAAATLAANLAAKNSGNTWAQVISLVATNVYGYATTAADLRTWRTLPRRIMVARVPIPENRRIRISGPPGNHEIQLGEGDLMLVHIRSLKENGPAAIFQAVLRTSP